MIADEAAEMLARAAIRAQSLKCLCDRPLPGRFDPLDDYACCQRCGNLIARETFVQRKADAGD